MLALNFAVVVDFTMKGPQMCEDTNNIFLCLSLPIRYFAIDVMEPVIG
jgi:hypothetical protein